MEKIFTETGTLTKEGEDMFKASFYKSVNEILSTAKSKNDAAILGTIMSSEIGKLVFNFNLK